MSIDKSKYGYVFNIQQFSVHDGPGIRTIVFLKGCPLRCGWCSNPESQSAAPELAWSATKCIGCHLCIKACRDQRITLGENSEIKIDRAKCKRCFNCADVCPPEALKVFGKKMSVDQVIQEVEADSAFYRRSQGGMTLSGGEALLQGEFAVNLLQQAKRHAIKTTIETCGCYDWSVLEQACQYLNNVIFDIKCMDVGKHKQHTGGTNETILSNFKNMCEKFTNLPILARTPIIPGFNDTEEDVLAVVEFIKKYPNVKYELLPYHRLGEPKYISLGREYPMGDVKLDDEKFKRLKSLAKEELGDRLVG